MKFENVSKAHLTGLWRLPYRYATLDFDLQIYPNKINNPWTLYKVGQMATSCQRLARISCRWGKILLIIFQ